MGLIKIMNALDNIVMTIQSAQCEQQVNITIEEYDKWKNTEYIIDILRGLTLGKAFCERYKLTNAHVLYYISDEKIAERMIKQKYIKHES